MLLVMRGWAWGTIAAAVVAAVVVRLLEIDLTSLQLVVKYWPVWAVVVVAFGVLCFTERPGRL